MGAGAGAARRQAVDTDEKKIAFSRSKGVKSQSSVASRKHRIFRRDGDLSAELYLAVLREDYRKVESLLLRRANPNIRRVDSGVTAVHAACRHASSRMVELLLNLGANPDARDVFGNTPLHMCVEEERITHLPVLLRGGADPHRLNALGKSVMDVLVEKQVHTQNDLHALALLNKGPTTWQRFEDQLQKGRIFLDPPKLKASSQSVHALVTKIRGPQTASRLLGAPVNKHPGNNRLSSGSHLATRLVQSMRANLAAMEMQDSEGCRSPGVVDDLEEINEHERKKFLKNIKRSTSEKASEADEEDLGVLVDERCQTACAMPISSTVEPIKISVCRPSSAPMTDRESARRSIIGELSDAVQKEYLELGRIGSGSFGSVHKVRKISTGEIFALKRVPCQDMNEANAILREVKLWNRLEHKNIVQYKDFLMNQVIADKETGRSTFEVMEYCSGGDLHHRLQREPKPSDAQVQLWMADLLKALAFLHQSAIVHRDIKPHNILLSDDQSLKLADFGVAKQVAKVTLNRRNGNSTQLAGTPMFMAPELMEGSQASEKVDIWSLGCVLLEIVGDPPLSRSDGLLGARVLTKPEAAIEMVRQISPCYSVRMKRLLEKMLQTDPAQRPTSSELLNEVLDGPA